MVKKQKSSNSDFYSKAIIFTLLGVGIVVGVLVMLLKVTGTMR